MKIGIIITIIGIFSVSVLGILFTFESEIKSEPNFQNTESDSLQETKTTMAEKNSSKNTDDDWKKTVFPELYNEDGTKKIIPKKVYVQKFPDNIPDSITIKVVDNALQMWEESNPKLKFEYVSNPHDALISINWVNEIMFPPNVPRINYHLMGLTTSEISEYLSGGIASEKHDIQVDLQDVDCNGNTIFWNKETVTNTISHEIGHALGIIHHSSDQNHLMYDEYDGINNILTFGLVVPQKISDPYYIGEKETISEMNQLQEKYEKTIKSYGYTIGEFETGAIELGEKICGNQFCSEEMMTKVNAIIMDELNPSIDKVNCFIESFSSIKDYNKLH